MGWKRRIGLIVMLLGLPMPAATQTRPQCKPDEYYRVTQKQCVSKALNPLFYRPSREPMLGPTASSPSKNTSS